ncbi:mechanosensitive ion channel family protein [Candidatus Contubernalis alkaliaceticus]|uniref:mechanosensitive ion channel family protein n=1 Tax=Candidatus Contubernalis alkaliaceticus TaxID=338645 RepID=UPI001F4BF3FC|nr:mechanosensitive ion channel family protein [Candidatus Contubernalis alkalaceticus]UNC93716.1 mechanosensitive ion channel family protein [Candidatus Contubernalis alkalaceticus]
MEPYVQTIQKYFNLDQEIISASITLIKILIIAIMSYFALRLGYVAIEKLFKEREGKFTLSSGKLKTLKTLTKSVFRYFIFFIFVIMTLRELDIDYTPILASAGILGLAVGFGAQNLIMDIITGFFLIVEGQYTVGDYITAGNYSGVVEEIELRTTRLRDFSGEQHIIPNGKIEVVTNHSSGNMRAMVDVDVAYEEDLERVEQVLKRVSDDMAGRFSEIKQGPMVLGVVDLADSGVTFRVIAYTEPLQQWNIEREMRKTIKEFFDRENIEIPYPRRVIYQQHEQISLPEE